MSSSGRLWRRGSFLPLAAALLLFQGCPNDQDQPDGPGRTPCNLKESPLCEGTLVCVMTCEGGVTVQYCREPLPAGLALGDSCKTDKLNCREGACMQEPPSSERASEGPRCTAFCVEDGDCPMDTHCVASNFSFDCLARDTFKESLCRPLSVVKPP